MQLKIHITQGSSKYVYHTCRMLKTKIRRPGSVIQEFILFHPYWLAHCFLWGKKEVSYKGSVSRGGVGWTTSDIKPAACWRNDCYFEFDVTNFNETKQNCILDRQKWKNRVVGDGENPDILCIYRKRFLKKN